MRQCVTCGGTYQPIEPDGTRYFHRCPSLGRADVAALIDAGKLGYPPGRSAAFYATQAAASADKTVTPSLLAADDWLRDHVFERPNFRDENITSVSDTGEATIIADGLGTVEVPDPLPATVAT